MRKIIIFLIIINLISCKKPNPEPENLFFVENKSGKDCVFLGYLDSTLQNSYTIKNNSKIQVPGNPDMTIAFYNDVNFYFDSIVIRFSDNKYYLNFFPIDTITNPRNLFIPKNFIGSHGEKEYIWISTYTIKPEDYQNAIPGK